MMKQKSSSAAYGRSIKRVIRYVSSHLEEELTVARLSRVAGFSKFHFHRQFTAYTGITVAQFVRLLRLKRAAYRLAFNPELSVLHVALEAAFDSPEAFSRAFKETMAQTPSEFRRFPQWGLLKQAPQLSTIVRSNTMNPTIVLFPETRIAALEHRGSPKTLMQSVGRFIHWRKGCKDSPSTTCRTFGIAYDDPDATEPDDFRFDICGELKGVLHPNDFGVVEKRIPSGRCAVARHVGSTEMVGVTTHALYREWFPQSGEQLRDFPCFFDYVARMPCVPEHEQITDIYLPLR
jgi:AraC family transcriptional regulator